MTSLRAVLVALGLGGVLALSAPAHADDQSFIDRFLGEGIGNGRMTPMTAVDMGHAMCAELHSGAAPAQAARLPRGRNIDGVRMVQLAQQEICPDTLGAA